MRAVGAVGGIAWSVALSAHSKPLNNVFPASDSTLTRVACCLIRCGPRLLPNREVADADRRDHTNCERKVLAQATRTFFLRLHFYWLMRLPEGVGLQRFIPGNLLNVLPSGCLF